jgi:hypothetical protein
MNCAGRALALLALGAGTVNAQATTGLATVDSAAVARAAYARGSAAARHDSLDAAQRELARAATAWPTQPAYPWALAIIAAARHDTVTVTTALEQLLAAGAAHDVVGDARFAEFRTVATFRPLADSLAKLGRPAPRSTVYRTLADSTLWPEGVDCTADGATCWVTSVAHRNVLAVAADGRAHPVAKAPLPGPVTAVRYDARRDRLWVATSTDVGPAPRGVQRAQLLLLDPRTGLVEQSWNIPGADSTHVLGDLALSPDGDVLVSDSRQPTLYLLARGATALSRISHPLFRSLQGVAFVPRTPYAVVADYSHGLLRVNVSSGEVRRVDDAPGGSSLGIDGLVWYRGSIVGVQNGFAPARVVQLELDASLERITAQRELDRNFDIADEPTSGTLVGNAFVYVATSSWEKHDDSGVRLPHVALRAPILLRLPLPAR